MRQRVRYGGRVQGVGFRATARSVARKRPVTGWVRNEPDGSVLLEVQGEQGVVNAVLAGIREALGRNIRSEDSAAIVEAAGESDFEIRHF